MRTVIRDTANSITEASFTSNFVELIHQFGLGLQTGSPVWGCTWLSSVPPDKCSFQQATAASFHILSNSLFIDYRIIRRCTVWAIDSVVK
jgi:hypothetical protein